MQHSLAENKDLTAPQLTGQPESNDLFPVFLKLQELFVLVIGGGNVGLEKLAAVMANSPLTKVKLIATEINPGIRDLALKYANIELAQRAYHATDLDPAEIVIVAVNDLVLSEQIRKDAKQ